MLNFRLLVHLPPLNSWKLKIPISKKKKKRDLAQRDAEHDRLRAVEEEQGANEFPLDDSYTKV